MMKRIPPEKRTKYSQYWCGVIEVLHSPKEKTNNAYHGILGLPCLWKSSHAAAKTTGK
jgi:hypothetical protein